MLLSSYAIKKKIKKINSENPVNKFANVVHNEIVNTISIFKDAERNKQELCELKVTEDYKVEFSRKELSNVIHLFKKRDQNSFFVKSFIYEIDFSSLPNKETKRVASLLAAVKFATLLVYNPILKRDNLKKVYATKDILQKLIKYQLIKFDKSLAHNQEISDLLLGRKKDQYHMQLNGVNNINKYKGTTNWKVGYSILSYIANLFTNTYLQHLDGSIKHKEFMESILEYGFLKSEYDSYINTDNKLRDNIFKYLPYNEVSQLLLILSDYISASLSYSSKKEEVLGWITETGGKIRLSDEPPMNWYQWTNLGLKYIFLIFWCIVILYPTVLFLKQAFNGYNGSIPDFDHFRFSTDGFRDLFTNTLYPQWLLNSIIISVVTMILTTFFAGLTAYVFSRFRFRGKRTYFASFLILQLVPTFTGVIVYYIFVSVLQKIGLPSYISLIIIYTGGGIVGNTLIIKSYMDSISHEIDDAATIDGCGYGRIYFKIILPLSVPILMLVAVWSFTGPFGDVIIPDIVLTDVNDYTVALGLYYWITPPANNPAMMNFIGYIDGGIIIAVPIAIIFIVLQRFVVEGMSLGGVKE